MYVILNGNTTVTEIGAVKDKPWKKEAVKKSLVIAKLVRSELYGKKWE